MTSNYQITRLENPTAADIHEIQNKLIEYNRSQTGIDDYQPIVLNIKDDNNQLVGGLTGHIYLGWLYINLLWVAEEIRSGGYGSQLLTAAEAIAIQQQCYGVYLDTFSFQALPFYQKHNYQIYGQLDNFPVGHSRYFLTKKL